MDLPPSVVERLARLASDQRAAATAPPGPSLCIAPAGSGKTTTLVARAAWLIATGTAPETIRAITFNKRAAVEMTERLDAAVEPLGVAAGTVRVRTFHALGREILRDAGVAVDPMVDRLAILREVAPWADEAAVLHLDTVMSRLKVELAVSAIDVARDPEAGPIARAFVAYEAAVAAGGGLDFDDLILRAIGHLERDPALLERWRGRCHELLVDEVQDVDRAQLRLALLLAAPANRIFLVGDDDQSIYGWRLADVRRILGLADHLPGLRRVDLEVNYRCPRVVVERAVRLVAHNRERFPKRIRAGPAATGSLVLAPDASDETVRLERAIRIVARRRRDTSDPRAHEPRAPPCGRVALDLGLPFRAPRIDLLLESPFLDDLIERLRGPELASLPLLVAVGQVNRELRRGPGATLGERELATAVLAWAAGHEDLASFTAALDTTRARLADLRRDDAALTLATAHATKGLEFDHVIVVGMEAGRFPSGRTVKEAEDPDRAYEEERRLGYVAWTRARRTLTLAVRPGSPLPVPAGGVQRRRAGPQPRARCSSRLSSRSNRSIESRNGSVSSAGSASRTESLAPYAARLRSAVDRSAPGSSSRSRSGSDSKKVTHRPSPRARASAISRSACRAAASPASSIVGRSCRETFRFDPRRLPSVICRLCADPFTTRSEIRRSQEEERQSLALGAVHQDPERIIARSRECQVPQVDRERQDGITAVALAARREASGRPGDLATIGIEQDESDLVFAVRLRRRDLESDDQRQVRVAEREPTSTDARDPTAEDMELLAGDGLRGIGKEREVDVWHVRMLAPDPAHRTTKFGSAQAVLDAAVARLADGLIRSPGRAP